MPYYSEDNAEDNCLSIGIGNVPQWTLSDGLQFKVAFQKFPKLLLCASEEILIDRNKAVF